MNIVVKIKEGFAGQPRTYNPDIVGDVVFARIIAFSTSPDSTCAILNDMQGNLFEMNIIHLEVR